MLIQVSALGSDTQNLCRTRVPIPAGAEGVKLVSINIPANAGAFTPEFPAGIGIGTNPVETVDVPAFGSFIDFKLYFNNLRTTVGTNRVFFAYGENEMDLCTDQYDVVLSNELASYLGLGAGLVGNKCYTTTVNLQKLDPVYDYKVVFKAPILAQDHTIGVARSTQSEAYSNEFHRFTAHAAFGVLEIFCRLRSGEEFLATCGDELWGVELEF